MNEGLRLINVYVKDIYNSLKNRSYFSALALALALPDMCGAAEYPEETSVTRRYIDWFDKYLGEYLKTKEPVTDLNGELLYNLRNQFLHSGSTNIDVSKVKNENNVLDKFTLVLGDGTEIWSASSCIQSSLVTYRIMLIDVTYLCKTICEYALWYYNNNRERFDFKIPVITQDKFANPDPRIYESNVFVDVLNDKLKKSGSDWRIKDEPDKNMAKTMTEGIREIFADNNLKRRYLEGEKITMYRDESNGKLHPLPETVEYTPSEYLPDNKTQPKPVKISKKEAQVRLFFGQNFKEDKYRQHKEQIIQAVLQSKSKLQVNNRLMKVFSSEETSIVYKRLAPLIKDMPGKI